MILTILDHLYPNRVPHAWSTWLILYSAQIVEEVDSRFHPNPEARLDAIVNQVQSTLLQSIPPQLERFTTSATPSQQDQLEDVEPSSRGVRATQGIGEVQEFVHEAMWGAAREEGVGQEDVDAD